MKYSIIKADLKKDRDDIVALWSRNFPGVTKERYHWIYENNPSGSALCWLAKCVENSSIIGATALFPRRFLVNGRYIMAGIGGDLSVDKEHRGLGLALALQKTKISEWCNENKFNIVYGFPNKSSEFVDKKAGHSTVGDVIRMTKPLSSYYRLKKYINIPIVIKIVSKLIDFGLRFMSKEKYYKGKNECYYEILSSFDKRFDALWGKVSTQFSIVGERSSDYLNWRYACAPHKAYSVFTLIKNENKDIIGYIVFRKDENKVNIDDFLCHDMEQAFDSLVSCFINYQRDDGKDSISVIFAGTRIFINKLKEFGFSIRDNDSKLVVHSSDAELLRYLLNIENWYLFFGDGDI